MELNPDTFYEASRGRNSEPQNVEGWIRSIFLNRQNSFLRHSTLIIRYSLY